MGSIIETMAQAAFDAEPKPSMRANLQAYRNSVLAAVAAAEEAGYVLVPKEPTSEMMTAWWPLIYSQTDAAGFKSGWAQMIAVVQRDRSDTP